MFIYAVSFSWLIKLLFLEKESKQDNGFAGYGKSDTFRL
jgi:hypothetical protein